MIISNNDHPDIRKLFRDLTVVEVDYRYTVGGGDRQTDCVELIYGTWKEGIPKATGYQENLFCGDWSRNFC
jgi:DNA adenine methylase